MEVCLRCRFFRRCYNNILISSNNLAANLLGKQVADMFYCSMILVVDVPIKDESVHKKLFKNCASYCHIFG